MKTKERLCTKIALSIFFLLVLCRTAGAQDSQKATLTAADAGTCSATSTACLVINIPSGSGGATFNIGANASANTVQFEASADYGATWVALSVTPSSSTTTVTSTTSTGAWQANVAGYTKVRMRCSTFVGGTTTTYINLSTASARSGGGGLPTGCTPGPTNGFTCTGNVLAANLPPALPTTPNGVSFIDCSTPAGGVGVPPTWCWPGVPVNAQTGTTYPTFAATDRGSILTFSNVGAIAVTPPALGSTNFANSFNFGACNINTGLVTFTPTTSLWNGSATGILPNHWCTYAYTDPVNNYRTGTFADIAAYPNCTDSAGNHLNFTSATGAFSCGTSSAASYTNLFQNGANAVDERNSTNAQSFYVYNTYTDASNYERVKASWSGNVFNLTSEALGTGTVRNMNVGMSGQANILFDNFGNLALQAGGANRWYVAGTGFAFNPANDNSQGAIGQTNQRVTNIFQGGYLYQSELADPGGLASATGVIYQDSSLHDAAIHVNNGGRKLVASVAPGSIHSTGLTAAVSTATLCAATTGACNQAGAYTVEWAFTQTGTACGTPGAGGVTFLLTWTDFNGTAHSAIGLAMDDSASLVATTGTFHFTTSNATAWASGQFNISSNGSIIQYATGYTACGVGTGSYELDAWVTRKE